MQKIIIIVLVMFIGVALTINLFKISREDYGIESGSEFACAAPRNITIPTSYPDTGCYDSEEVANIFLPYAVAALNAYTYKDENGTTHKSIGEYKDFTLESYSTDWKPQHRITKNSGLALDYYFNTSYPDTFLVLIAFRGTEFFSPLDWLANLSWFMQLLPFNNQYDDARESVREIYNEAQNISQSKNLTIITTGHSLGGGLAEHIAYAFPCTTAVIFNSSFVVNRFRLKEPFDDTTIFHIFERDDELTFFRRLFRDTSSCPSDYHYGINLVSEGKLQHSQKPFAVAMARMVADCQSDDSRTNPPGCPKNDIKARLLYCNSRFGLSERNSKICKD